MTATAIGLRKSSEVLLPPPISGVRIVPKGVRRIAASLAELHAFALGEGIAELAHVCATIEKQLSAPQKTTVSVQARSTLPPIDLTAGLGDLLGARAREVTPIVAVREPSLEAAATRVLVEVGKAFPLICGEEPRESSFDPFGAQVEVVVGKSMASVQGFVVPVCSGAPPSGTRVIVGPGPRLGIYAAKAETTDWLDVLAVENGVRRAISLGLVVLRRARVDELAEVCRRVASALVDLDPVARDGLAGRPLGDDAAARAIGHALSVLSVCQGEGGDRSALRAVAAAAMLQAHLDTLSIEDARAWLTHVVLTEPTLSLEVVVAWQVARIRRGRGRDSASMHARLVALACEPTQEERKIADVLTKVIADVIELEEGDLVEIRPSAIGRESLPLPKDRAPQGRTKLEVTPLAKILAVAHERRLSGTLLVTDPGGGRHALLLSGGTPIRARDRSGVDVDPCDLDGHFRRITAIASLPPASTAEFYQGCDLLVGMADAPLVPCTPHAAVLAAARAPSALPQLRALMIRVGTARRLALRPTRIPLYSPTEEEAAIAARVLFDDEPLSALGDNLDFAIPLVAAVYLMKDLAVT
jgi:hypothetical protein